MADPLVSIIVPCYNAERWLADALNSALSQTCTDLEVIVIDDGSVDASRAILSGYGSRIRWETGPNRGANHARNRGLALARGQWIQFLDSDDLLHPQRVEILLEAERQCGCGSYVWADYHHFASDQVPSALKDGARLTAHDNVVSGRPFDAHYAPWAAMFRKSFLDRVGPWNETLTIWDDLEYHARIIRETTSFVRTSARLYGYRQHGAPRLSDATRDVRATLRSVALAHEALMVPHIAAADRDAWFFPFYLTLARVAGAQGQDGMFRACLRQANRVSSRRAFGLKAHAAVTLSRIVGARNVNRVIDRLLPSA